MGAWADPFPRADWVLDLMPYATRGLYSPAEYDRAAERFDSSRWVQRDICSREPWPFADDQFDFAICSHTLEDVRDPIWVCSELSRVARAGYVETPSRLEEQSLGVQADGLAGWSHHRWLVDDPEGSLRFVFKSPILGQEARFHFPSEFGFALTPSERLLSRFWEGELPAHEVVFTDADSHDAYLADFVAGNRDLSRGRGPATADVSLRSRAARRLSAARQRLSS